MTAREVMDILKKKTVGHWPESPVHTIYFQNPAVVLFPSPSMAALKTWGILGNGY
jgi:hypothetical protein